MTRKTEKGLPTYTDQDVFVLSGAEDLVPALEQVADDPERWKPVLTNRGEYTIRLYRPRTEGQFARIEQWTGRDGNVHWRATTKENVTSIYGRTLAARILDPKDPEHVFEWLLEETFDARGNHMLYEYVQDTTALNLRSDIRVQNRRYTQVYIRRILYGNTPESLDRSLSVGPRRNATDHLSPLETRERHYLFQVLFDYGDLPDRLVIPDALHHGTEDTIPENWPIRPDPFSSFRAGFEIRTQRRCRRVLILHHFKEGALDGAPLVKSTDFHYAVDPSTQLSMLSSASVTGYRKDPDAPTQYLSRSMPPVTFTYSRFEPERQQYQSVTAKGEDLPPRSLSVPALATMDLFGNGLADILQDTGSEFRIWENLGRGLLERPRPQSGDTPTHSFSQPGVSIGDMGGDGLADLVVHAPPVSGFYESTPDGRWKPFKPFEVLPTFDLGDPNTRLVDLTGDGLSDVLVTDDTHFRWYRCRGEAGYDAQRRIPRLHDPGQFPDVFFADPAGRVRLADMTGDGLNDIVLVHDGRIDYWPNLGYGRFGPRITMTGTPRIGYGFDPSRLFLADLDGSGCSDLVYVEDGKVRFWFNQSGNGWSSRHSIRGTPQVSDATAVQFIDFYGTGTTTLLWSYDAGSQTSGSNYKILDLCGGKKPHLLVEMSNNMGATTRVQYASSTKFYLEDRASGNPWITSLPFPVQVVEKTEVIDHIGKTKLVTCYKYHHGYYDGRDREFRGFGRVDQFDTEFFDEFSGPGLHGDDIGFDNRQKGFHVPPVESSTWFHTGIYFDADRHLDHRDLTVQYRNEYYKADGQAFVLDGHVIEQPDDSHSFDTTPREALRALRGAALRTEIYGRDGSAGAEHPYLVTENRYRVKALQPKAHNNHAVYFTAPEESISYHYERNPDDPRISQSLTLGIDDHGNITDTAAVAYPRRIVPDDLPEQGETKIVYTHTDFINQHRAPTEASAPFYYAGVPHQTREYEVTGIEWHPGEPQIDAQRFVEILDRSPTVDTRTFQPHEWQRQETDTGVHRRIIEWSRAYFRTDMDPRHIDTIGKLDHRLALGEIDALALPYESYQAAFTQTMLDQIYGDRIAGVDLAAEGGYHPHPDHPDAEGDGGIRQYHWVSSGRQGYDPKKFFQTDRAQDPFGHITSVDMDAYALLIETTSDALPSPHTNVIAAENDYSVLQPSALTDPNGNRSAVAFDALGMVAGTAIMGEDAQGRAIGDNLDGFLADLPDEIIDRHIDDPLNLRGRNDAVPDLLLQGATTRLVYDLHRFARTNRPNVIYTLARETHLSDERGMPTKIQHIFNYSDGFGRESQSKVQAEPDPKDGGKPRWVGSGTTVYNNKGMSVQQYEPFFSIDHRYGIEQHGVSPTLFHDPLERIICIVHPNHTYEKVVFDPWRQTTWDSNDTVLHDPRTDSDIARYVAAFHSRYDLEYRDRHGNPPGTWHQEHSSSDDPTLRRAAEKTEAHASTPSVAHLDVLARPTVTIADNGPDDAGNEQKFTTRLYLDIRGNQRAVIDALDRKVIHYDYDMLGNLLHQSSMEAGERWILIDASGNPIRNWDSTGHQSRTVYDELRRPSETHLRQGDSEFMVERLEYGDSRPSPEKQNLRGMIFKVFDQAGVVTREKYDFKGNLLSSRRQLAQEYRENLDWSNNLPLEAEVFSSHTRYDALNRPIDVTTPDESVIHYDYNEANLLKRVEVNLQRSEETTPIVDNIDYNARGQRQRIDYGNRASTSYRYDPLTHRLVHLLTRRKAGDFPQDCPMPPPPGKPGCHLQNLHFAYDPVGNIINIRDEAQQTIFFRNRRVDPINDYTYDAIYRLIDATGREHIGQNGTPVSHNMVNGLRTSLPHPGDGNAMGRYREQYIYDPAGNILSMHHNGSDQSTAGWEREYAYEEPSLLEPEKTNNRLSRTSVGTIIENLTYHGAPGLHGNVTSLPHLPLMHWDYRDQLRSTARQVADDDVILERTWYIYNADGQRIRKVTDGQTAEGHPPSKLKERIYLGEFEIYRKLAEDGSTMRVEHESLRIADDLQRIALIETLRQSGNAKANRIFRYQIGNHIGSAHLELDDLMRIISYEEYTPYGNTTYQAMDKKIALQKRYRFTGNERDGETGLGYHGVRYYMPWLGRWTSCDPGGLIDGSNLYRYARCNPISLVDPDGQQSDPAINKDEQASLSLKERLKIHSMNLKNVAIEKFPVELHLSLSHNFTKEEIKAFEAVLEHNNLSHYEFIIGNSIELKSRMKLIKEYVGREKDRNKKRSRFLFASDAFLRKSEWRQIHRASRQARRNRQAIQAARNRAKKQFEQGKYRFGLSHMAIFGAATSETMQLFGVDEDKAEAVGQAVYSFGGLARRGRSQGSSKASGMNNISRPMPGRGIETIATPRPSRPAITRKVKPEPPAPFPTSSTRPPGTVPGKSWVATILGKSVALMEWVPKK